MGDVTPVAEAVVVPVVPESADHYPVESKQRAYKLFLHGGMAPQDIAIDLGIDARVIRQWARQGNWMERKQQIEDRLIRAEEDEYRKFLMERRLPTAQRHERIASKIEEAIETLLADKQANGTISDMALKRLSEALSSVTGVSARAVALPEGKAVEGFMGGNRQPGDNRVPIVVIGLKQGDVRVPVTIDVESTKVEDYVEGEGT
jgi:transposase-like protein